MNGNGNGNANGNGGRGTAAIVADWITSFLGALTAIIFIGFMAWSINVMPLWIIAVGVLAMMVVDIVQGATGTGKKGEG